MLYPPLRVDDEVIHVDSNVTSPVDVDPDIYSTGPWRDVVQMIFCAADEFSAICPAWSTLSNCHHDDRSLVDGPPIQVELPAAVPVSPIPSQSKSGTGEVLSSNSLRSDELSNRRLVRGVR